MWEKGTSVVLKFLHVALLWGEYAEKTMAYSRKQFSFIALPLLYIRYVNVTMRLNLMNECRLKDCRFAEYRN